MTPELRPERPPDPAPGQPATELEILRFKARCFDDLQVPLWAVDANERTTVFNGAVERELGYTPAEVAGRSPAEFLTPESRETYRSQSILRAAGMADSFECTFITKSGGRKTMLVSGAPIFDGDRFAGKIAVLKDISAWQATDETGHIIETLTHDARTQLTTIVGFTALLLREIPGPLNDEQRRQIRMVHEAADRVLGLVTALQAALTAIDPEGRKAP